MKKIKYFILISIVLSGLVFLFGPEVIPENLQPQEVLNIAENNDVIIVFNSGGWGNTPLEEAEDFSPIIKGIQETIQGQGYKVGVVSFNRTKDSLFGKMTRFKEFFSSFEASSGALAGEIEDLIKKFPNKKIIMAGLSNGGTFVAKTYEKISGEMKKSVLAIEVGTPFWAENQKSENILQLDNSGRDALADGDVKLLLSALFEAPLKWFSSKINGRQISFSKAFHAFGHDYYWPSLEVGPRVAGFLNSKIH